MSASTEEPRSIYIDQRASPRTTATATATAHRGSCEQSASRFCRNGICLSLLLLMARLSSKLLPASTALAVVILCLAMPSCKAQDAVQIVARAALCFDNHTVINRCLKQMGIGTGTAAPAAHGGAAGPHGSAGSLLDKLPTSPNASAALCGAPCFGNMMLVADCVDGILSNFQGYSAGLMQGVRAVFQMSCAGAGTGAAGDDTPAAHGALKGGGGGRSAASGKEVTRNVSGSGATTAAGAAVPAANGGAPGGLRRVGNLVWVGIIILVAQYGGLML
ncbi:hypothetical protein PVAP13_9KG467200 [Panicum virgatum]|uniref:Uncharacterized protein n=1 Tax=Panicum virgatum TaxID=38727 RepID=A0A8T0P116_PANVG|nr:hypothetical protein PVAP13_9KG467200 [Panicum virgatum]